MTKRWVVAMLTAGAVGCGPRPTPHIVPVAPPVTAPAAAAVVRAEPAVAAPVSPAVTAVVVPPGSETAKELPVNLPHLMAETEARLRDVYFSYDRFDVRADAAAALEHNAAVLRPLLNRFPQVRVTLEGHCDERGSDAYNLALGDQRARRAVEFLRQLALDAARFDVISYGRERPQCSEASESCWQRNRRAHFKLK